MAHGADDYLVKPFSARELLAKVGAHLELARVRREAASVLQRSRQQLDQVVGSIRDQFFALDSDWRYTFANDRVLAVTGLTREQLLGHSVWELFPRVVGTDFEAKLREAANQRKPARFYYDDPGADGERRYANRDAADRLGMLLGFLGAEVRVEHGGEAALEACEEWRPTVVLLDLGMPGMDGFEVARRLRANPANAGLKLVALTGWGQERDRARTETAGFDHHLIKPVDMGLLQELLDSMF